MKRLVLSVIILLSVAVCCPACGGKENDRSAGQPGGEHVSAAASLPYNGVAEASVPVMESSVAADEQTIVHAGQETQTSAAAFSPETKEEILAAYRQAVKNVRSGGAGYNNKTWQSARVVQMTGIAAVDEFVNTELNRRATPEARAETVGYEKGTQAAMAGFPDCSLEDADQIVYAASEQRGENVNLTIIMQDEDTPLSVENSMLGKVTDIILFKNEIERELRETLPVIKDYEYSVLYRGFEIVCELTKDGKFVSLRHHAVAEVNVSTVRLFLFTLTDKSGVLIMDSDFSDFVY